MKSQDEMYEYFSGRKLYGDDFNENELLEWYKDEAEGYAELGSRDKASYSYHSDVLNREHGFRHLPDRTFTNVLSLGGAWAHELRPIVERIEKITILEPSNYFDTKELHGVPVTYVKPSPSGHMPFQDGSFQLLTCFGTLHHIANVTTVLGDSFRCLEEGGYMLLREPVVSMGDWRHPRPGLTKRERGIPRHILRDIVQSVGFKIIRETRYRFPVVPRIATLLGLSVYNTSFTVKLDRVFSWLFSWNNTYHATMVIQKFRPTAVFFLLEKPVTGGNTSETMHARSANLRRTA